MISDATIQRVFSTELQMKAKDKNKYWIFGQIVMDIMDLKKDKYLRNNYV